MSDSEIPGLDLVGLRAYVDEVRPGMFSGPLSGRVLAGGMSNLTYSVSDGASTWVVRRPPLGHVLATAHDMAREFRVIGALADTAVPVPVAHLLAPSDNPLGYPFYVMEHVVGSAYRNRVELEPLGRERAEKISRAMIVTLAQLHSVQPNTVGLEDFGRPHGFLHRQAERWRRQMQASDSRTLPSAERLHQMVLESLPTEQPAAIVHGDFRLDNLLVADDQVKAVIDWEMSTLGDPLTDVALLLVHHHLGEISDGLAAADASTTPGFMSPDELLATYEKESGRDLSSIGVYMGLAYYKLAAILEGIHFRHVQGHTFGGNGFDTIGQHVEPLLQAGVRAVEAAT